MSGKIGRNDPCWCGSGKKLKKCHPDSSRDGFSFYDFEKIRKEVFSKKTCMVSKERNDCSERICKAHTVSKSALSLIAENGHLYHFEINGFKEQKEIANGIPDDLKIRNLNLNNPSIYKLRSAFNLNPYVPPSFVGLNDASTFNGFCEKHDRELFSPLENKLFIDSDEQYFLLYYRAICRKLYSLYASENMNKMENIFVSKDFSRLQQRIANNLDISDMVKVKEEMDNNILTNVFSSIRWISVETNIPPIIMTNEIFAPKFDCKSKKMKNMEIIENNETNKALDWIVLSSFSYKGQNRISLIWLEDSNGTAEEFYKSFVCENEKVLILQKFITAIFASCENIYFSMSWWNTLPQQIKEYLCERFHDGTGINYSPNQFKPIDIPVEKMTISGIKSNFLKGDSLNNFLNYREIKNS